MKSRIVYLMTAILLFVISAGAQQTAAGSGTAAVVPQLVKFSGNAKGPNGQPLTGLVGITFALYSEQQGGTPLWLETQNVQMDSHGNYTVELGATQASGLPAQLFTTGEARWVGVQISGQAEQPRILLTTVPYAMKAVDAQTVGGLPASAFVLAAPPTAPSATSSPGVATSSGAAQPNLSGGGTTDYIPIWTNSTTLGNSLLYQSGTGSKAKVGINTTSPASTLDVKGAGTVRGLFALPAAGTATSTTGYNSQPLKQTASVFNSGTGTAVAQNFQWQAEPVSNDTSSASGTLNLLFATGSNKLAETGLNIASNGQITFAKGQTFPGTGTITGVTAGTDLTGGGTSGNVTLNVDTTKIPQLSTANTFTGNQTVNGNVSATGVVTGSGYQIGSNLFDYGSYSSQNAFLGFAGNTTTTGTQNTASGANALASNTKGSNNTAAGVGALYANTTGTYNTAAGSYALGANTTGDYNTATGGGALNANTTGAGNTATGVNALWVSTTGNNNTADGSNALHANTTGYGNTAVGSNTLSANTTGNNNTAGGVGALPTNTTGSDNTASGSNAGTTLDSSAMTGSNNTFLGNNSAASTGALANATAIGANAVVSASNALVLGCVNGVNSCPAAVNVGIGTATPAYTLDVQGSGRFTQPIVFASGQTFPGTGTITGVTAGTDLTGGGTSGNVTLNVDTTKVVTGVTAGTDLTGGGTGGNVTLNLDTTKVPQLAANNTFAGTQTINNNVTVTATGTTLTAQGGTTGLDGLGTTYGVYGQSISGSGVYGYTSSNGYGVYGNSNSGSGVYGVSSSGNGVWGNSSSGNGVYGVTGSSSAYGVYGYNTNTSGGIGVFGYNSSGDGVFGYSSSGQGMFGSSSSGYGVYGESSSNDGVSGYSSSGQGMFGSSSSGYGVYGESEGTAAGTSGVYGQTPASSTNQLYGVFGNNTGSLFGAGVYGQDSTTGSRSGEGSGWRLGGAGVWGDGGTSDLYGVLGTADNNAAVYAANNSSAANGYTLMVWNSSTGPLFWAFNALNVGCYIDSSGDMYCTGSENAAVPIDSGQRKVALSAIESPKNWFEDFGSAQLSNGSAVVAIEPEYAQTVNTELEYHVFVTPNGDCKGLYVSQRTPTSFEVRELGGGTSSIEFSYRIVALRKNYENIRMADHTNDPDPMKMMGEKGAPFRFETSKMKLPERPAAPMRRPPAPTGKPAQAPK